MAIEVVVVNRGKATRGGERCVFGHPHIWQTRPATRPGVVTAYWCHVCGRAEHEVEVAP